MTKCWGEQSYNQIHSWGWIRTELSNTTLSCGIWTKWRICLQTKGGGSLGLGNQQGRNSRREDQCCSLYLKCHSKVCVAFPWYHWEVAAPLRGKAVCGVIFRSLTVWPLEMAQDPSLLSVFCFLVRGEQLYSTTRSLYEVLLWPSPQKEPG